MFDRLAGVAKEYGVAAGTLYLIDRALRALSSRLGLYVYEFMVQPITGKPMLPANFTKRLTWEELGAGHPDLARVPGRERAIPLRLAQGAKCLGVYRAGVLLGLIWLAFERYREDEVRCDYELVDAERSVFDFDLYVMPEHRMGLGFLSVWHIANEYLARRGVAYTFSRLTRFNVASRKSHAHLGWRRVGSALFLKIGTTELMAATVAPFLTATFAERQRVRLRLRPDVLAAADPHPLSKEPN